MTIFSGWENYVERIEQNWKKIITPHDSVVIPGDLSWALKLEEAQKDFQFLEQLPGQKFILKGNHDLWWTTLRKMQRFLDKHDMTSIRIVHNNAYVVENIAICGTRGWFYDDQSSDQKVLLREAARLERSIQEAEKTGFSPVVFLHYPPVFGDRVCPQIYDVLVKHQIKRCYYGHLHGVSLRGAFIGERDGIQFRLVSCDALSFTPYLVSPGRGEDFPDGPQ